MQQRTHVLPLARRVILRRLHFVAVVALTLCWGPTAMADQYGSYTYELTGSQASLIRGHLGLGQLGYSDVRDTPDRKAWALDLRLDFGVSAALTTGEDGVTYYDAVFLQFNPGWLASEPLSYLGNEGKMSLAYHFGYLTMLGWRFSGHGVFVGLEPAIVNQRVGETKPDKIVFATMPFAARADVAIGDGMHAIATGWWGTAGVDRLGAQLELVFNRVFGLYVGLQRTEFSQMTTYLTAFQSIRSSYVDLGTATGTAFTFGYRMGHWR